MADHPTATKAAGWTAAGLSAAVIGGLVYGNIKNILGGLGKTGVGIAAGKAIEAATGVTPVFVTNMPAGGILGAGGPGTMDKMVTAVKWLGGLGAVGAVLTITAIGAAILTVGTALHSLLDVARGGDGKNWISEGAKDVYHGWWGDALYDWRHPEKQEIKPEVKNTINLRFDKDMKLTAIGDNGADFVINVARGNFN